MQLDRLTNRLQEALVAAQQAARRNGNPEIQPEHPAQALLAQKGHLFPTLRARLGVDVESTRRTLAATSARVKTPTGFPIALADIDEESRDNFSRKDLDGDGLEESQDTLFRGNIAVNNIPLNYRSPREAPRLRNTTFVFSGIAGEVAPHGSPRARRSLPDPEDVRQPA